MRYSHCASLVLALLIAPAIHPALAGTAVLSDGQPDPNCPDLRLWLRADAGVRDAAGHGPSDPDFNGSVATWSDQSARHFDLAASDQEAPVYLSRQPGAGNRPTVAFGGGRVLARSNDALHDQTDSTTLIVMQVQRGTPQGSFVFCAGDPGQAGSRESLVCEASDETDSAHGRLKWSMGEVVIADSPQFPADGRFAIVILRSAGQKFVDGIPGRVRRRPGHRS